MITSSLGLIDCIEFLCGLTIFSNSRVEDKIRFLFEFFDMNDNNYLEECDLQLMFLSCINAISKLFAYTDEPAKEEAF
jgi:Ca2+-binding EF-hand superfamily protein